MKKVFLISLTIFLLGQVGCVTSVKPPTQIEIASAEYGPYPANYPEIIKKLTVPFLKDPESATFSFEKSPEKGWAGGGVYRIPISFGWGIFCSINAKNSFGGYVGAKRYFFLIKNDNVVYTDFINP